MPVPSYMSGWRWDKKREKRESANAPDEIVIKAQPVARRNRDQRLAGSLSQSWVMVSNRARPRPLRAGIPSREASQRSVAHAPSRSVPWEATTLSACAACRIAGDAWLIGRPLLLARNRRVIGHL